MKTKIEFNEVYRPNIESGEYKVETRDGRSVRIVAWDRKEKTGYHHSILGLAFNSETGCEEIIACNSNGKVPGPDKDDLFITWEMPELTEFQRVYLNKVHHLGEKDIQPSFLVINEVKENCDALMAAAEKEIAEKFNGNYAWLKGREQAYENMKVPMWKPVKTGYGYVRCLHRKKNSYDQWDYSLANGKLCDGQYISLEELGQLPTKGD